MKNFLSKIGKFISNAYNEIAFHSSVITYETLKGIKYFIVSVPLMYYIIFGFYSKNMFFLIGSVIILYAVINQFISEYGFARNLRDLYDVKYVQNNRDEEDSDDN